MQKTVACTETSIYMHVIAVCGYVQSKYSRGLIWLWSQQDPGAGRVMTRSILFTFLLIFPLFLNLKKSNDEQAKW